MSEHIVLGNLGEDMAAGHLADLSYTVKERNWRYQRAEVDLIAMDQDTLVFVEVKTRSYIYMHDPEDAINLRKRHLLIEAAAAYMREHDHDWAYRFDVISIVRESEQRYHIKHLVDAFEPNLMG